MGYERNERGYGSDTRSNDRYDRGNAQDGRPQDNVQERGFFDRAGDELRSWFGDEEAERRRRYDERFDDSFDRDRGNAGEDRGHSGAYRGARSSGDYPRYDRSNRPDAGNGDNRQSTGYRYSTASNDRGSQTEHGYRSGGDRDWRENEYRSLYGDRDRPTRQDDPHGYHSWRDQQISSFDRDYDEYRRENQSRFASEFSAWREGRQTQRNSLRQAKEHQEVVGSDDVHVGTVDHVRGDRILLTKDDKDAGGHHHSIPSSWIRTVDDRVHLAKTAEEAHQAWRDEENNRGLFGRDQAGRDQDHQGDRGSADLNRSFSGTY